MYGNFAAEPGGVLLVADSGSEIAGLVAGTAIPGEFFGRVRRRHGVAMALSAIPALVRHPIRVGERLLAAIRYRGDRPAGLPEGFWLLSSLGVARSHARRGIGATLVEEFCIRARDGGARGAYLLTDQDDNDTVRRFYAALAFREHVALHRRDGRRLLVLTRTFGP
jgi:GNAT superfamily N-acetyltransferase